jgi:hypothetical protein|tara:strand:+ start:18339 stop:20198 length:1860 start_codon:yes stop_codon:yes gene_type:complete
LKNRRLNIALLAILSLSFSGINAQEKDSTTLDLFNAGSFPKIMKNGLGNLSVSGYYRFIGNYTEMKNQYPEFGAVKNTLFLGDDSNIPQLHMTIGARPSSTTSFSTDLFLWDPLSGAQNGLVKGLNLGVNLNGSHSTKYGNFNVRTGGIHWYSLSPFTFATNTGYNRYSLFERNPWDPNTKGVFDRYSQFYEKGALGQDVRWGQQAFQGFIFDGNNLPQDFSFALMYGKSQFNGGALPKPNSMLGGKIRKDFKKWFISLNAISNKTFDDSLAREVIGYELVTSEFNIRTKYVTILGEIGAGSYHSPNLTGKWGEAIDVRLQFPKKSTYFPIEARYFYISPNVINNNGIFWNTSISEFSANSSSSVAAGSQTPLIPFASSLVNIGQMTNNRRGIILNADLAVRKQKLTIGYSAASEINGLSNQITYGHPANNLALSRFWRWAFPAEVGPYQNLNKIYRGVYETVYITDSTNLFPAKGFTSIELSYKGKFKLFNRDLMFFYLAGFHSVQSSVSFVPVYSKKAYLQSYNNQFEFYYHISPNVAISNYFGWDRIIANDQTTKDVITNTPRNQLGTSYSIGLDILLSKNVGLYVRQRWMNYKDVSFSLDQYKGTETTVELKLYF